MILKSITTSSNRTPDDILAINKSNLRTYVYGAGSYAMDVSKYLDSNGVKIDGYCVDKDYLGEGYSDENIKILAVEDATKGTGKVNIILGMSDYVKAKKRLDEYQDKTNIYFIDAPDRTEFFNRQYVEENEKLFDETYQWLCDKESKEIFLAFINAKISGDPSPLYDHAKFNQYFPEIIELSKEEVFVDCGAFDGDTLIEFAEKTRGYKKIIAFEPDGDNYVKLQENIKKEKLNNVDAYELGCWSEKAELKFNAANSVTSSVSDDGDIEVQVDTIDRVVGDEEVSFIKMDIEGTELGALKGAKNTIKNNQPKLAICVYHKPEDLITIPQYIKSVSKDYDLYLRQHQYVSWDMVLYALPRKT